MRFGLGWRSELGAGILANLDRIEVVEVLAEEFTDANAAQRRALRFLAAQVPVVVHATSLGLASSEPVDERKLAAVARVIEWLQPESWSEHLSFVRGGGREVGHLAAPPRNARTLEGLCRNVERATRFAGARPLLENVASLVEPPCSTYDEAEWLHAVATSTGCRLLLDLHNLWTNSVNFRFDAVEMLRRIPHDAIGAIHVAGGVAIERGRILDDHLHAVPDDVFSLLEHVDAPDADVVLERDGRYPPVEELLCEVDRARAAARTRRMSPSALPTAPSVDIATDALAVQRFLARIYSDAALVAAFLDAPEETAARCGLSAADAAAVGRMDGDDLRLAWRSFARKREAKERCVLQR